MKKHLSLCCCVLVLCLAPMPTQAQTGTDEFKYQHTEIQTILGQNTKLKNTPLTLQTFGLYFTLPTLQKHLWLMFIGLRYDNDRLWTAGYFVPMINLIEGADGIMGKLEFGLKLFDGKMFALAATEFYFKFSDKDTNHVLVWYIAGYNLASYIQAGLQVMQVSLLQSSFDTTLKTGPYIAFMKGPLTFRIETFFNLTQPGFNMRYSIFVFF